MVKIAIFGPRPTENGILTKKDGKVWKEIQRVLLEEFSTHEWDNVEFLVPVYSKFDIEVLSICERKNYPVHLYIPTEDWGSKLPNHRKKLIQRVKTDNYTVIPGELNRLIKMVEDADAIYMFPTTSHLGKIQSYLDKKPIRKFPIDKMAFTKEDEIIGQTSLALEDTTFPAETENVYSPLIIPDGMTKEKYLEAMNIYEKFFKK